MFEAFLIAVLVVLVVLAMRGGKPVVLDNPLVIQRPGQYHITLAPQLGYAQNFLEHIVGRFAESGVDTGDIATQYFEVRDPGAADEGHYLLAVGFRSGMLYFQAINPLPLLKDADSHPKMLRRFSEQVMVHHPLVSSAGAREEASLRAAVDEAAGQLKIACDSLQEAD